MSAPFFPEPDERLAPAHRLAEMFARFEANRRSLGAWIDRSWLPAWAAQPALDSHLEDCSAAIADALALPLPNFAACCVEEPVGDALAMLTMNQAVTALRLRALWFRRNELRRIVGRESRDHCLDLIGAANADNLLRLIQMQPSGPQIEPLYRLGLPALGGLSALLLAWEGWCLFRRDGAWRSGTPTDLVRLALPRDLVEPEWLDTCDPAVDRDGSIETLKLLPHLYPEQSWSFGFAPATAN